MLPVGDGCDVGHGAVGPGHHADARSPVQSQVVIAPSAPPPPRVETIPPPPSERGAGDVLAPGPLDVGRRELELVARPVRVDGRHRRRCGSPVIGYSSRPAATSGWTAVGRADRGCSACHACHCAAGCSRWSAWPAAVTMSRSRARPRSSCNRRAAVSRWRWSPRARRRRRSSELVPPPPPGVGAGGLAARPLDAERQQLGVAARTVCAAAAWRDDMGAGPLGTAADGGGWIWLEGHWA